MKIKHHFIPGVSSGSFVFLPAFSSNEEETKSREEGDWFTALLQGDLHGASKGDFELHIFNSHERNLDSG